MPFGGLAIGCGRAGDRDRRCVPVPAEPGVRRIGVAVGDQPAVERVEAGDPGVGEAVRRRVALALDVVVEPLRGEELGPVLVGLRAGAAVVPAGEPGDPHRRAGGGDAAGVGVRLGQRESVSTAPWMSSVGALIRSSTVAGLERRSSASAAASGVPVVAIERYAAQTSAANRPHAGFAHGRRR